jgi:hypothetical protein
MNCPHCGGLIEIVAARPEPDSRQTELPFIVELRHSTKYAKKVVDAFLENPHASRARDDVHGHVHGLKTNLSEKDSSLKHEHDHVLGQELTPAQQDLLNQIEELVACENRTQHYRTTWIMRIREHPNQVFAAIGEARLAKREGRIRHSVGGALNWHFGKFREAARARTSAKDIYGPSEGAKINSRGR